MLLAGILIKLELRCTVIRIGNELLKEAPLEFHPSAVLLTETGKPQMKFQKLSRCQLCYFLSLIEQHFTNLR